MKKLVLFVIFSFPITFCNASEPNAIFSTEKSKHPISRQYNVSPYSAPAAKPYISLWGKTNLIQWGLGITNIGAEVGFGDRFSIDVPFTYSPYRLAPKYRMQVILLQPEFRWWPGEHMYDHFVGFHAHVCWFNVALGGKHRFQDPDRAAFGFGVSYGYALPVFGSPDWSLEMTAGVGYANFKYDRFSNNGAGEFQARGTRNYFGITRLGVSLSYRIIK